MCDKGMHESIRGQAKRPKSTLRNESLFRVEALQDKQARKRNTTQLYKCTIEVLVPNINTHYIL